MQLKFGSNEIPGVKKAPPTDILINMALYGVFNSL